MAFIVVMLIVINNRHHRNGKEKGKKQPLPHPDGGEIEHAANIGKRGEMLRNNLIITGVCHVCQGKPIGHKQP